MKCTRINDCSRASKGGESKTKTTRNMCTCIHAVRPVGKVLTCLVEDLDSSVLKTDAFSIGPQGLTHWLYFVLICFLGTPNVIISLVIYINPDPRRF